MASFLSLVRPKWMVNQVSSGRSKVAYHSMEMPRTVCLAMRMSMYTFSSPDTAGATTPGWRSDWDPSGVWTSSCVPAEEFPMKLSAVQV